MIGHRRGFFERAAILQISRYPRRPKRMIADLRGDPSGVSAAADHLVGVGLGQGRFGELVRASADRAEQWPLRIGRQASDVDIGVQIGLKIVMAGHGVALATLFVQQHPQAAVLHENVLDLHRQSGADPREGIDHQSDQSAVAQAGRRRHINAVEKRARLDRIEHRRLAGLDHMPRPAHGGGRIDRRDLSRHQPVE